MLIQKVVEEQKVSLLDHQEGEVAEVACVKLVRRGSEHLAE